MLLDIIPLVDRWDESNRFVDCSTFAQRCITDVPYSTGPIEEVWYPLGREFDGPGASRYERYKVVEHVGAYIIEYIAIGYYPINVVAISKNRDKELLPICSKMYNFGDQHKVNIHYFTNNILDILDECWVYPKSSADALTTRSAYFYELERAGELMNNSMLLEFVADKRKTTPTEGLLDAAFENSDVDNFFDLGKVIMPLKWDEEALIYPWVQDAIIKNWNIPKVFAASTFTRNYLNNRIGISDLIHSIDMRYHMHPFTRKIPAVFPLTKDVRTNLGDYGNDLIYGLNKFIEQVPYTEFKIDGVYDNWQAWFGNVYYSANMGYIRYNGKYDTDVFPRLIFNHVMEDLTKIASYLEPNVEVENVCIVRSFNEDVYITLTYKDMRVIKIYADLVYTILGSRGLFTDYECSWFA